LSIRDATLNIEVSMLSTIAKMGQAMKRYQEHRTELTKLTLDNLKETGLLDTTFKMIGNSV